MQNKEIKETKCIFSPAMARRLLANGHQIKDIAPNRENRNKTVFVFCVDDTFIADLTELSKREDIGKEWSNG